MHTKFPLDSKLNTKYLCHQEEKSNDIICEGQESKFLCLTYDFSKLKRVLSKQTNYLTFNSNALIIH